MSIRFVRFRGSFCYKNSSYIKKKRVVCNQHYRNIHDPIKLINANKSSILLLGLPINLETLFKNLLKGTECSVKLQDWGVQRFQKMSSFLGV